MEYRQMYSDDTRDNFWKRTLHQAPVVIDCFRPKSWRKRACHFLILFRIAGDEASEKKYAEAVNAELSTLKGTSYLLALKRCVV